MTQLAEDLTKYSSNNEFIMGWLDRSRELGAMGGKSTYPFNIPEASDLIRGWDMDTGQVTAVAMIQAVSLARFMGDEGDKEDFDQRLTGADFDDLSLALLGWACICIVSGDMNDGLLSVLEGMYKDKDQWITALGNITTYHGWQFGKVYPEEWEEADSKDVDTAENEAGPTE